MDLDRPALEFADVADTLQITGKNHNRESAQPEVIAEVQKVHSALPLLDPYNFAHDALDFTNVFSGFIKGNTVRPCECAQEQGPTS